MFLEEQRFWFELVNVRRHWTDERALLEYVPERHRAFSDPPGWSMRKAFTYLVNNVDLIRTNHAALEAGRRLDYDMLNHVLSQCVVRIVDWGDRNAIRTRQAARARAGGRIETLVAVSRPEGLNAGSVFIRHTVERAVYYFGQYVDYRFADPAYPGASPGKFQVKECLFEACRKLYVRTPEALLYCSDDCARADR